MAWLAPGAILVLAFALRLWKIHDVPGNVFYDAAVRSMGTSWHDFFFGALEPSGTVSIDKPPVDLWLQVASTRVLGFGLVGLHLPEALGGVAACGLLFGALRRAFGLTAALTAALALAVLPVSVLTARSDTMDSVLAALEVAALWLSWRALESGRMRWSVLAAAVMGVAFNVKLSEMLIALPALALLWLWAAAPGSRMRVVLATAGAFSAVALSWTAIASLTPTSGRPFPIGSANGSIWHVTLVYNGLDRLSSHGATGTAEGGAGPLRLLSAGPMQYWTLIGVVLLAASLLGLSLLGLLAQNRQRLRMALRRPSGRLAVGIVVWFLTGLVAFSAMERLQTRYLEAFAPAVCAVLGCSLRVLWRNGLGGGGSGEQRGGRASAGVVWLRVLLACVGLGLLTVSLNKDVFVIRRAHTDSLLSDFSTPALSHYLRTHRDGAHYEVAGANISDVTGLVARDGLPVLVLNSVDGVLTRTEALQAQVAGRRVRFYLVAPHPCHSGRYCPYNQIWAYAHSSPVRGQPGLRRFTVPASPAHASVPVAVSIDQRYPGTPVPRGFLGLSFELSSLSQIARYGSSGNFTAMLRSLGPGVLRFGGVSADTRVAWTDAAMPLLTWASAGLQADEFRGLRELASRSGWHILLTIGLAHYDPRAAAREAAAASRALGGSLMGIALGNEPDAYARHGFRSRPWTLSHYNAQVAAYRRAIERVVPGVRLLGPDVSGSRAFAAWGRDVALAEKPALLTGHHYPLGCHNMPTPTIASLLSRPIRQAEDASLHRYLSISRATNTGFRLDEANTVSCGGKAGVSDTFAATLWALDYIARAMTAGAVGINLQGNPSNCHGYTPVCASTVRHLAEGELTAQPEWYALLLCRELVGGRPVRAVASRSPANIDVIALVNDRGKLQLVIVDDDPPGAKHVSLKLHVGRIAGAATALPLTAPSLAAQTGVRLGGQAVESDGRWPAPAQLQSRPDRAGVITLDISPASAMLVTVADEQMRFDSSTSHACRASLESLGMMFRSLALGVLAVTTVLVPVSGALASSSSVRPASRSERSAIMAAFAANDGSSAEVRGVYVSRSSSSLAVVCLRTPEAGSQAFVFHHLQRSWRYVTSGPVGRAGSLAYRRLEQQACG
jgi:4-amino-4-deoxy-L-arabinose transferase-like glycosyltransferase